MEFHPSQRPAGGRSGFQPGARVRLGVPTGAAPALILFSLLATLGAQPGSAARPVSVKAVRHWSLGDVTRIAVETTGEFRYKFNRLPNPPRVYFDILNARQRISPETVHTITVGDELIEKIRVSQNRRWVARVVLDLKTDVEVSASQLVNPHRLIIEVRRKKPKGSLDGKLTLAVPGKPVPKQATKEAKRPVRAPEPKPAAAKTAPATKPPPVKTAAAKRTQAKTAPAKKPPAKIAAAKRTAPKVVEKPLAPPPKTPPARETAKLEKRPAAEAAEAEETGSSEEDDGEFLIAKPARRNSTGGHSLTRVLGLKLGRIVIDPGHGGRDTGTIGPTGLREKDVTLDVSKRLARLLEERLGAEVILTRTTDKSLSLERRTEIANKALADLFVSVHVNSSRYRSVNGVETFYLNLTRSRADLEVAARENAGSNKSIHELTSLIQKIALDDKLQESRDLAANVQTAVYKLHRKLNPRARNRGVKKAPFVVLIGAKMPSILVEVGFISNPREEKLLKTEKYRHQLAEALYDGIAAYADSLSHFQVARSTGPASEDE